MLPSSYSAVLLVLYDQAISSVHQVAAPVRAADADAAAGAEAVGNRGPPSLLVRIASAFLYIVPWIDILMIGRQVHHFFPNTIILYLLPGKSPPRCVVMQHQLYVPS